MAENSEIRDGMQIDWDVPITMDDGVVVRADIFRPVEEGRYPVILTYGPYGKGLDFKEGYTTAYEILERDYPDSLQNTTAKYMNWEVVDPEKWVHLHEAFRATGAPAVDADADVAVRHFEPHQQSHLLLPVIPQT